MKKTFFAIVNVLILITVLVSCSRIEHRGDNTTVTIHDSTTAPSDSKANVGTENQTKDETLKSHPEDDIKQIDINEYMRYFVNYFHEPYNEGDEIPDVALLSLCFRISLSNSEILDFVNKSTDISELIIRGEGLREMARVMIDDSVDLNLYHRDMDHTADVYLTDNDLYVVEYARGYWNEDPYYLVDSEPLLITETEDIITVVATVQHIPQLGTIESVRKLKYTFEKILHEDILLYKISQIETIQ